VLVCFWSPKGGSGTSVVAAASGLLLARHGPARVADLAGDQAALFAVRRDPTPGLRDWLRAGPETPRDALDRIAIDVGRDLALLPAGEGAIDDVLPESGAALAVALNADTRPVVCDAGLLDHPALAAVAEVSDVCLLVVRGCYLALRRAVYHEATAWSCGIVLIDEHGRSLGARDVEDVLGLPVVATIEACAPVARSVDAGTLASHVPTALARPLRHALVRVGCIDTDRAA
jgi:hypothetical protein